MIQEKSGYSSKSNPMVQKESFDEFYTRKLEAVVIELKAVVKGDIPYATSTVYACKVCSGRIKLYSQSKNYCLFCDVPPMWPQELRTWVTHILQSYPSYERSLDEWKAMQELPPVLRTRVLSGIPTPKYGNAELGLKIREARVKRKLTQEMLASRIYKNNGKRLSESSIQGYETGNARPPEYVLEQLEKILHLELKKDGK